MKKIILVGPIPPPSYGQSVSFEMLKKGLEEEALAVCVVDINNKWTQQGKGGQGGQGGQAKTRWTRPHHGWTGWTSEGWKSDTEEKFKL